MDDLSAATDSRPLRARLAQTLARVDGLLARLEPLLPPAPPATDWGASAFLWRRRHGRGALEAVPAPRLIDAEDLIGIERQKERFVANIAQFVAGKPANNVLLSGARGTGKSSLVRALLPRFAAVGLRLIEVDKQALIDLPDIVALLAGRSERYVLYCDDLSFEAGDAAYKALKSALDGSLSGLPEHLLLVATSNRRHLMPEALRENLEVTQGEDGEIHPGETSEEKISLSERFGLWLSFHPFDQETYWAACRHWLCRLGLTAEQAEAARAEALRWALDRGGRSGRIAHQFARDYAGRQAMQA